MGWGGAQFEESGVGSVDCWDLFVLLWQKPPGPPYALLQGTLYTEGILYKDIPREAAPVVQRGHVCLIGAGPDFFISLAHHPEWGHGHTVFGEVVEEDMKVVDSIVGMPTKAAKWAEVEVRELAEPLNFMLKPGKL